MFVSWILAAAVAFLLGAKAFTKDGIPLTRNKKLNGVSGKICGVLCILLGMFLAKYGVLGFVEAFSDALGRHPF